MNRFNQPVQNAGYKGLSFQELAFAPIQMRQREDTMNNQKDEILKQMHDIVGYEGWDEETNAMKTQMKQKLEDLSAKIQKGGAGNQNYINEFRNLRNEYNQITSKTGALGMSSALKESMDSQKDAFYKMALAQGHSNTELIEQNWLKEVEKYKQQLPGKVSGLKGQLPVFNPMLPPKDIEIADKAAQLANMMGTIKDEVGEEVRIQQGVDEDGNPKVMIVDINGYEIDNNENIKGLTSILRNEILDPRSEFNQNLRWKGYDPKEFLENMGTLENYATLMRNKASGTNTKTRNASGGTGSTSSSSGSDKHVDKNTFVATDNSSERLVNSYSTDAIEDEIRKIDNDQTLTYDEKNERKSAYIFAKKEKQKQENSPEFIKAMDEHLADKSDSIFSGVFNPLNELNIRSWEDWQEFKKSPKAKQVMDLEKYGYMAPVTVEEYIKEQYILPFQKETVGSKDILANSEHYTFGFGKGDNETHKILSQGIQNNIPQLAAMAANGQIEMAVDGNIADLNFERIGPTGDMKEQYNEFLEVVGSGNAKVNFGAINSGSAMAGPELQYSITAKIGDRDVTKHFTIDLKNNAFTQNLLDPEEPLYQSLDKKGKDVLDNVRDNINYAGLAVTDAFDSERLDPRVPNEFYSDRQTKNIVEYSKKRDEELFNFPVRDHVDPTDVERFVLDSKFIKPGENAKYNVMINDDGSYSTYKKDANNNEIAYTFEDYFKKTFAASYAKAGINSSKYTMEYLNEAGGKELRNEKKVELLQKMVEEASDINDPTSNMLVYSDDPEFIQAIKDYRRVVDTVKDDRVLQQKALEAYNKIASLPVQSKRRKLVL